MKNWKRPILLTGSYGKLNTGDDALAIVTAWGARRYWDAKTVGVLARNLPVLPQSVRSCFLQKQYFRGQALVEITAAIRHRPLIVFGGGSIFSKPVKQVLSGRWLLRTAKRRGVARMGAIGVSLGPFKDCAARDGVADFLAHLDFLTLRDERSYEEACRMVLPFEPVRAFDLAALLPFAFGKNGPRVTQREERILGVSLCHYERYVSGDQGNELRRERQIDATLQQVVNACSPRLRFLAFSGTHDTAIARSFAVRFGGKTDVEVVGYTGNTPQMWTYLSECSAVLATRLHAGVFSCFSKTPFLQVEYHQKCSDFLDEIGYPTEWRVGDMNERASCTADKLVRLLTEHPQPVLIQHRCHLMARALKNFLSVRDAVAAARQ